MKKRCIPLIIFIVMLISIFLNYNISYAKTWDEYIDGIAVEDNGMSEYSLVEQFGGEEVKDESKFDFNYDNMHIKYTWLHNLNELLTTEIINKKPSEIAKNHTSKEIFNVLDRLEYIRGIIHTFTGSGKEVSFFGKDGKIPVRSIEAFKKITGYETTEDYEIEVMTKAMQILNAAKAIADDDKDSQFFDDYYTKFMYTAKDIYWYVYGIYGYGTNYNCDNPTIIAKVWNAKLNLKKEIEEEIGKTLEEVEEEGIKIDEKRCPHYKFKGVLTDKNLYVSKDDEYTTKMCYNIEQIWLYKQLYGDNYGLEKFKNPTPYVNTIKAEWENMIEKGEHTSFFNQNKTVSSTGQTSFNPKGDENYNSEASGTTKTNELDKIEDFTTLSDETNKYYQDKHSDQTSSYKYDQENANNYHHPTKVGDTSTGTTDEAMQNADNFIDSGSNDKIKSASLQDLSNSIYNIALIAGIVIAVLVGAILGIKFMTGSVEEKADVKKLLIPYVVGCVVIFGAFGIWKLVVTILSGI